MDETQAGEERPAEATLEAPLRKPEDDYLIPGPTATSNEGLLRWGLSWLVFSFVLMAFLGVMSFVCWWLATITGIA